MPCAWKTNYTESTKSKQNVFATALKIVHKLPSNLALATAMNAEQYDFRFTCRV